MAKLASMVRVAGVALAALAASSSGAGAQDIFALAREFPLTDFSTHSVDLSEIWTGAPRRGSFPTIFSPRFVAASAPTGLGPMEPVISVGINGDWRAYPLRILLFHEIVNDVVGGVPILVTYCPLCNSGVVFERTVEGEVLVFDNTARLRRSDMLIYDKGTESWWQQYLGEAIVGERTGQRLTLVPARRESIARFRERAPEGRLLVPENPDFRPYGLSGGAGIDGMVIPPALAKERFPFDLPEGISPLARVVVVGEEGWALELLRREGTIESGDLVLTWEPGQNSIHDQTVIARGRDVGIVVVQRKGERGLVDVVYDVSFVFAFAAFKPDGVLHRNLAAEGGEPRR